MAQFRDKLRKLIIIYNCNDPYGNYNKMQIKNIVHNFYILSIRMYINGLKKKKFPIYFYNLKNIVTK